MQAELHDSLCRLAQLPHMYREPADQGNAKEYVRQANKMEVKKEAQKVVQVISRALRRETKLETGKSQAMPEGVSIERNNDYTDTTSVGKSTGKLVCRVLVRRGGGSKAPAGRGATKLIRRSGGKLLIYADDPHADPDAEHELTVDLHGATIMLGGDLDTGVRLERSGASGLRESYIYSDGKDPRFKYAVEIRMSPSEFARHDFELRFSSSALAVAWQLRLIKGVVHHGKTSSVERPVVTHGLGSESEGEEREEAGAWGKGGEETGRPVSKGGSRGDWSLRAAGANLFGVRSWFSSKVKKDKREREMPLAPPSCGSGHSIACDPHESSPQHHVEKARAITRASRSSASFERHEAREETGGHARQEGKRGLTQEELQQVGRTFTFVSQQNRKCAGGGASGEYKDEKESEANAAGVGMLERAARP